MARYDILVIGGGIVGLTAAIASAGRGARVLIVDAGVNAGSNANAGSLHVQLQSRFIRLYPDQAPNVEASLPLYLQAVCEWERLDSLFGSFELVRKGGLMLAEGEDQLRFLELKARREEARGLSVEILDRRQLDVLAPWLGPQIVGAELCRDEGKLNPLTANLCLRAEARRLGVGFVTDQVVLLHADASGVQAKGQGGQVHEAEQAVVAAAWGSGPLLEGWGAQVPSRAEPLHMNITEPGEVRINHLIQHAERSITLKQFGTGQIVIGGGWAAQDRGNASVPNVLAASILGNVALAGRLVPSISRLRVLRTWAGMNTTVDGKTVIGRLPAAPNVIVAVPGDAGYTLGPLVGRAAMEIAAGQPPSFEIANYNPSRFAA